MIAIKSRVIVIFVQDAHVLALSSMATDWTL